MRPLYGSYLFPAQPLKKLRLGGVINKISEAVRVAGLLLGVAESRDSVGRQSSVPNSPDISDHHLTQQVGGAAQPTAGPTDHRAAHGLLEDGRVLSMRVRRQAQTWRPVLRRHTH